MERRGSGFIRNEGEVECLRVVEAAGTTLTAHTMGRLRTGQSYNNYERSELRIFNNIQIPCLPLSDERRSASAFKPLLASIS